MSSTDNKYETDGLIATDIDAYLKLHENKEMLRFLTCGNVDDGKSTLIGRLLYDSKMIYEDQLDAVTKDSVKSGTTGETVDLALLVDGLQAEREQGITIDVAYRYFSTTKRKFIIADTPGHEQYTRNMATGASNCQLAVILIDARYGVQTQTRRHSYIASLLGIKHIVVAINKMDIKGYSEQVYNDIRKDYTEFARELEMEDVHFVPLSALLGDNVVNRSENMPWYEGETLMQLLDTVEISGDANVQDVRFPVQYVNRPNLDFRGYCGTLASGVLKPGDAITVLPSGKESKVKDLVTYDGDLELAIPGQAITVTLEDEIDISRGDMIVHRENQPHVGSNFKATVVWMIEQPLVSDKQYNFKVGVTDTSGTMTAVDSQIDVNTLAKNSANKLELNEIGVCEFSLNKPVVFDAYKRNHTTGAFIVIDRLTNVTVGAGMITEAVSGAQAVEVSATNFSEFEVEFNALVRKHFPHWDAKDLGALLK
ncbi:sulfate adenylyltransferase subunit CysN [Pseudomonadota bacterium]|nr:sulfate adenylyltransferase subunit CysN [Pseudomonadota bacterium]